MKLQENINQFVLIKAKLPDYYHKENGKVYSFIKETHYELYLKDINDKTIALQKESYESKIWNYKKINYDELNG